MKHMLPELGQSLSDFGKAVKLLGTSEGNSLGKAFSELGAKCELQSIKLQKEVIWIVILFVKLYLFPQICYSVKLNLFT